MALSDQDLSDLQRAKRLLENPSLASKITAALGIPIEKGFELLPVNWNVKIQEQARKALVEALDIALLTMENEPRVPASTKLHKLFGIASGAIGGAFGLPALVVELPISTTIMLRSIADVARSEGEDLSDIGSKLACLQVFALGGSSTIDDAAETGYFVVRSALAKAVSDASAHIAEKGLSREGVPAIARLIGKIAERFGIAVSQKAAAQAVPIVGAGAGALVNTLFIDHFQDIARGHFTVRRLERAHGVEAVRKAFDNLQHSNWISL